VQKRCYRVDGPLSRISAGPYAGPTFQNANMHITVQMTASCSEISGLNVVKFEEHIEQSPMLSSFFRFQIFLFYFEMRATHR